VYMYLFSSQLMFRTHTFILPCLPALHMVFTTALVWHVFWCSGFYGALLPFAPETVHSIHFIDMLQIGVCPVTNVRPQAPPQDSSPATSPATRLQYHHVLVRSGPSWSFRLCPVVLCLVVLCLVVLCLVVLCLVVLCLVVLCPVVLCFHPSIFSHDTASRRHCLAVAGVNRNGILKRYFAIEPTRFFTNIFRLHMNKIMLYHDYD
jgi:hypothetical protein